MEPEPLDGFVWLELPGKVLHTDERHLEFTDGQGRVAPVVWAIKTASTAETWTWR